MGLLSRSGSCLGLHPDDINTDLESNTNCQGGLFSKVLIFKLFAILSHFPEAIPWQLILEWFLVSQPLYFGYKHTDFKLFGKDLVVLEKSRTSQILMKLTGFLHFTGNKIPWLFHSQIVNKELGSL